MNEKIWMVANTRERIGFTGFEFNMLPIHKAPRFIHDSPQSADAECLRLASLYDGEFVVLEAVRRARKVSSGWANLTTKNQVETIKIEDIPDQDSEIPF
ncbi:hypothetical protein [Teredinibacter turnerae]|uniref:hypothetical protein n=1 Tax=Teredinibacter turnerae TaxID=2426 RepID=UPI0030D26CAA